METVLEGLSLWIDNIKKDIDTNEAKSNIELNSYIVRLTSLDEFKVKIGLLLEKEKQQIKDAYDAGYNDYYPPDTKFYSAETYYNETYKTKTP